MDRVGVAVGTGWQSEYLIERVTVVVSGWLGVKFYANPSFYPTTLRSHTHSARARSYTQAKANAVGVRYMFNTLVRMKVRMNINTNPAVHVITVSVGGFSSCACGNRSLAPRYRKPPAKKGRSSTM